MHTSIARIKHHAI